MSRVWHGRGVRLALPGEYERLQEIEEASDGLFAEAGIGPFPDEDEESHFDEAAIVLVSGDPPVGFACVGIVDASAHLWQLSVHPSEARRGRGSALVTAVCEWAASESYPGVTLTTFRDVAFNAPFYARRGFRALDDLTPGLAAIRDRETRIGHDELGPRIANAKGPALPTRLVTGASAPPRPTSRAARAIRHHGQVVDPASHPVVTDTLAPTDRTTLRRKKERGTYDRHVVNAILDEGLLCHVGFRADGSTFVIPMAYARVGDTVYLHGATGNRMLRFLGAGAEVCITVTLLDGLVLARSAFHHSMNYRSVMLFGTATRVVDDDEKRRVMTALLDHVAPGRSTHARAPSPEELRSTLVVRVPVTEGSAKVRTGGPIDEPYDMAEPIWAGHIPLSVVAGVAVTDGVLPPGTSEPSYVRSYPARGHGVSTAVPSDSTMRVAEPGG